MPQNIATHPDQSLGQIAKLLRVLREGGLLDEALQWPINDPKMRARLIQSWNLGCHKPTTSQWLARKIMGINFFGIEEADQYFNVKFSKSELQSLISIPFSEDVLRKHKNTHILICVPRLSIHSFSKHRISYVRAEESSQLQNHLDYFTHISWHLVQKTQNMGSQRKNRKKQQEYLFDYERVPYTSVLIYSIILFHLATKQVLFENLRIGTADANRKEHHIHISPHRNSTTQLELKIYSYKDDVCSDSIGLASEIKPQ